MRAWSFRQYGRPYLAVDDVYTDESTGGTVLVARDETFDIAVDGHDPREVVGRLRQLRDPDSRLWAELATAPDDHEWVELTSTLDTLGLLANRDDELTEAAEREAAELGAVVDELLGWLRDPGAPWSTAEVVAAAESLDEPAAPGLGLPAVRHRGAVNMPLTAIRLQRMYWAGSSPLLDAAASVLLARLRGSDEPALTDHTGGPDDPKDAIAALHAVAALLALATRDDAARVCAPQAAPAGRVSGLNLVLAAEQAARVALAQIGPAAYVTALEERAAPLSFVRAACVEEYRITRRFVETIVPALTRRFREPLRRMAFRYYREEYGHERYERKTCLAAGVTKERLDGGLPMPYHLAYIDNYIAVAQRDAVTHLAAVMVTEGLPGDPFGINDLVDADAIGPQFAEVFRRHEAANDALAHNTLARHLLAEVPSVTPAQAAATLDTVTYLIELTHRAWSHLYDAYADGPWARYLPPRLAPTER